MEEGDSKGVDGSHVILFKILEGLIKTYEANEMHQVCEKRFYKYLKK